MTKDSPNGGTPQEPTPQEKAKAIKWFEHGKTVADTHNYDYAIECYVNGLALWPDAVDEGHKPLRAVAFARLGAGKKKPGMLESLKFQTSGGSNRDALQGMLNAEKLLAKDPNNIGYMEAMLKNAHRAGFENTCLWLGPTLYEEAAAAPKANQARFTTIHQVFEDLGNKYNEQSDLPRTVQSYELAIKAVEILARIKPDDRPTQDALRNLGGKMAIAKGKFEAGDFRESLRDADKQREMRGQDGMVQDEAKLTELIASARASLAQGPDELGKVLALRDLLLRRGRLEDEEEAIRLLLETYQRTKGYQFKMAADDIRIKQLYRQARLIKAQGDLSAAAEQIQILLDFEIDLYKERVQQYPTEGRLKYELGKRYFFAQRFDDAVPILQLARNDPKHRMVSLSLIAQCFYHKGYHDQAINTATDAVRNYELVGDEVSKELHYWLGRSQEASGQKDGAIRTYGQIIQWDYNYRDVRQRLESLQAGGKNGATG